MSLSDLYKNLRRCGEASHYWAPQHQVTKSGRMCGAGLKSYSHSRQHVGKGDKYHWRELPQVLFLSRQTRVCRGEKNVFCCDKDMLVTTTLLSRQNYVATSILLSRQTRVCRDKTCICRDKTRLLSRQNYVCRNKYLSRQKTCLSQQKFSRDKNDTCGSSRQ